MFQLSVVSIHYSSPRDLYQLPAVTSKKYSVVISTDVYNTNYPRRARSALGVDTVLTLDVCLYVCMLGL